MTQEEKELYNAANAYAFGLDCGDLNTNRDTFIAGANWQKEQIIEKACYWFADRYQVNGSYLCADDIEDFVKFMKGE